MLIMNNKLNNILFNFKDCVAVVSGGYQGIGKSTVDMLAYSGAKVYTIDPKFSNTSGEDNIIQYKGFTDKQRDIKQFIDLIASREEHIDFLVNNAGIYFYKQIEHCTEDDFKIIVDANLKGLFNLTRHALPLIRMSKGGAIVNVASVSGKRTEAGHPLYSMTKGGILALTKALAADFGVYGIRVNSVSPGNIITPMNNADIIQQSKIRNLNAEAIEHEYAEESILKRRGFPEEISSTILFLLSDGASYINGADITIDGGLYLI